LRNSPARDKWIGEAPLRETLAAFCLQSLIGESAWAELRKVTLVDPMAGSGTIIVEAARMHLLQHRHFAFQDWKAVPKALSLKTFFHALDEKRINDFGGLWGQIIGSDSDRKAVESMQHNISGLGLANLPTILQEDIFEPTKAEVKIEKVTGPKWLILNAPYGERLKWNHTSEELCTALVSKWKPERLGILWSEAQAKTAPNKIQGLSLSETYSFKNGGIPVSFQIWK
jgi:putative N6-adenine-specific DNA methylase